MEKIKEMYSTPILYLYDASRNLKRVLNTESNYKTCYDVQLVQNMNEVSQLTFKALFDNGVISYDSCESLIKIEGNDTWFIIKTVEVTDSDSSEIQITAMSEEVALKGILCSVIDVIAKNPSQMFAVILSSVMSCDLTKKYIWGGTDVDENTTKRALQVDDETSVFENLLAMAEVFEGWFEFNHQSNGTISVFLRCNAIDKGKYIMKGKDLKDLNITYDSSDIVTQLFAFGATDSDGVELNIMNVNPTRKSYVQNIDYYLSLGMTEDEILSEPRCLQQKIFRDDVFTVDTDLYNQAISELNKVCIPTLTGTIGMLDFSVIENTSITEPVIGENVIVINIDTKYVMNARIDGVTRKYTENPLDIEVTISNVISYSSVFRDMVITSTKLDKLTGTNGDGSFIKDTVVKDNNGLSLHYKLDDLESNLQLNAEELQIKFDDWATDEHSSITQNAENIALCVTKEGFGTEMIQNSETWRYLFNHTSSYIEFDETGIWCRDEAFGTGYTCMSTQGLVHMDNKDDPLGKQYHYLSYVTYVTVSCDGYDYTRKELNIPTQFAHINPNNIAVTCSIKKVYDSNSGRMVVPYWFGAYASVGKNSTGQYKILIDAISVWRDFSEGTIYSDGLIDISLTLVA